MATDDKLIKASQDAYLWLYDNTGIYVGTVGMICAVIGDAALVLHRGNVTTFTIISVALAGFICFLRYWLQNSEKYEIFNAVSRAWAESLARMVLNYSWLFFALMDLLNHRWLPAMSAILNLFFFGYVLCWQIRKREPPEKLVFAPQGSN